eukprot:150642-Chlamydomonas_euryale.AAC.1
MDNESRSHHGRTPTAASVRLAPPSTPASPAACGTVSVRCSTAKPPDGAGSAFRARPPNPARSTGSSRAAASRLPAATAATVRSTAATCASAARALRPPRRRAANGRCSYAVAAARSTGMTPTTVPSRAATTTW